jgi:hypothetical protein
MRAAGRSWKDIASHLQTAGVKTAWGNDQWVAKSCRAMMQNRVYLGEARHGEYLMPNAHPALVDEVTWRRAALAGHRPHKAVGAAPSVLQGVMRCGSCRHAMGTTGIRRPNGTAYRRWSCTGVSAAGRCPGPASVSTAMPIEKYVVDALKERAAAAGLRREATAPTDELTAAVAELQQARHALEVYRDDPRIIDLLGADAFAEGLSVRVDRVSAAESAVAALQPDQAAGPWEALAEAWDGLDLDEQREVLRAAVQAIFIKPGRSRHESFGPDNVHIAWRGDDVDLPAGVRSVPLAPLRFADPPLASPSRSDRR